VLARELKRAARPAAINDALTYMERFLRARAKDDLPGARRAALKVKDAAPRAPSAREALGRVAFDLGEWHEAAQELLAFRRLTGEHRNDPAIAHCYLELGRAVRALEFLTELKRDDVGADVWARACAERARALGATGRGAEAANFLTYQLSREKSTRARATLAQARADLEAQ
jgi:lipopolysaccharide biosynthesis regulator YciM